MKKQSNPKNAVKNEELYSEKLNLFCFQSFRIYLIGLSFLVLCFAFLLYSNTINHYYALDDTGAIQQNVNVKKGISGIPDILKMDLWEQSEVRLGYYRPLSLITFAIEYEFFKNAPHVHHFTNVVLFALSCVILFLVMQALLGNVHQFIPLFITLLFAAHPIHTEVVANIKSRDEILSFLFVFAALLFYIFYLKKNKLLFIIPAIISAYLGMMSKETALTGLLLIPVIHYLYTQASLKSILIKSLPFIGVVILFFIQKKVLIGEAIIPDDIINYPYTDSAVKLPTTLYLFFLGCKLLVLPVNLRYDYSYNLIPGVEFNDPLALVGFLIFAVGGISWILFLRKKSIYTIPLSIFFFSMAPGFAFTFLRGGIFAERFLYSAALGFIILLILLVHKLSKRLESSRKNASFIVLGAVTLLLVIPYSIKTIDRNLAWKDNYTLFSTDIKTGTNSAQNQRHFAEQTLVKALAEKDSVKMKNLARVSLKAFDISISMHPKFAESYMKSGVIYQLIFNKPDSAIYHYRKTIECEPTNILRAEAYYNLGTVYQNNKANLVYASYCYNQSLKFKPDYAPALQARNALKANGINTELEPTNTSFDENSKNRDANYYFNLGYKRASEGKYKEALIAFEEAYKMNPTNIDVLLNLANCYGMLGDYEKSIEFNNKIISLKPDEERAYRNNAINYEKQGNLELSRQFLDKANAIKQPKIIQ
ncbi:MAG: tetratricopeptide repeat protein [Bacteroidota bacterium]